MLEDRRDILTSIAQSELHPCRLPELYAASRGVDVSPALGGGVSRPPGLGSPPDLPLPARRGSMQLGSPLGRPPDQQERPSPAAEVETTLNRTEVSKQQDGLLSSRVYSFELCAAQTFCLARR